MRTQRLVVSVLVVASFARSHRALADGDEEPQSSSVILSLSGGLDVMVARTDFQQDGAGVSTTDGAAIFAASYHEGSCEDYWAVLREDGDTTVTSDITDIASEEWSFDRVSNDGVSIYCRDTGTYHWRLLVAGHPTPRQVADIAAAIDNAIYEQKHAEDVASEQRLDAATAEPSGGFPEEPPEEPAPVAPPEPDNFDSVRFLLAGGQVKTDGVDAGADVTHGFFGAGIELPPRYQDRDASHGLAYDASLVAGGAGSELVGDLHGGGGGGFAIGGVSLRALLVLGVDHVGDKERAETGVYVGYETYLRAGSDHLALEGDFLLTRSSGPNETRVAANLLWLGARRLVRLGGFYQRWRALGSIVGASLGVSGLGGWIGD